MPDLMDASVIPIFEAGYDRTDLFVCSRMTLFDTSVTTGRFIILDLSLSDLGLLVKNLVMVKDVEGSHE